MSKKQKISDAISWVVLVAMIGLLIFTITHVINAKKTGEAAYIFGYRPVLVLTGSMEPYMMTNSIAITKEVTDINELEVGDVVTYHVETTEGKLIRITHRIIDLDDGIIYTKGDNNGVADGYLLTMENIESEVVCVFNGTAWLAAKWQTTTGKIFIISFATGIICLYYLLKVNLKCRKDKKAQAEATSQEAVEVPVDAEQPVAAAQSAEVQEPENNAPADAQQPFEGKEE